ncbi:hypothetical protein PanWU01x14_038760 [Parasponia andersonii]|uniref:Uncharacterized protein n=1 Tax=Parasponia andersonii TaxID=3476 RepID=A0A2P5DRK6_PARAD|nr:hypothetical protein PanWU01x14_038760 [Parasponia andersonii]
MHHYKKQYLKLVVENKKPGECKYIVYGFGVALQYWAYEAVLALGTVYATYLSVKFSRMLCWTSNKIPSTSNGGEILNRKKVNVLLQLIFKEKDFHSSIMTSIHDPRVTYRTNESVGDLAELDANKEHLKKAKVADETAEIVGIFSFHEPKVGDKNLELKTLAFSVKTLQADIDGLKATQLENKLN